MLESGIDRIISQVVDPKINHIFRPQVEKAVHEFLATLNHKEEASPGPAPPEEKPDASVILQGVSTATPNANVAKDAMSILETITSLNQEASAARASTETVNAKTNDRASKKLPLQHSLDSGTEKDRNVEELPDGEKPPCNSTEESSETGTNSEDTNNLLSSSEDGKTTSKEVSNLVNPSKEAVQESDEQKNKPMDKSERKSESSEKGERKKEKKEKLDKKLDHLRRSSDDSLKTRDEKAAKDRETESIKPAALEKNSSKPKANEHTKEALEDSDLDVLSDITVSSVHTSDLSSFEEESEEEVLLSDSTEEGEIVSEDEEEEIKTKPEAGEPNDKKTRPGRHAYVHKPYLYSKYYSDSDDEQTVEQRRQSVAREKEERLLRRRLNREKLEERRKQKAAEKTKALKVGKKGKSNQTVEVSSARDLKPKAGSASNKEALKEQRFLEKKVALSRKRKRESRHNEEGRKKEKKQSEEDLVEPQKINESGEKPSSKEVKTNQDKTETSKLLRRLSESVHSIDENKSDPRTEKEHKRKASVSLQMEGTPQDTETRDPKSQLEKTEANPEEPQKQKKELKNEKHIKKDDLDTQNSRSVPKKEGRSSKDKNERERTISEEKSLKHKSKSDSVHKAGDEPDSALPERGLKSEENTQKHSQLAKALSDDKAERKNKHRNERKASVNNKDVKNVSEHVSKNEDGARKENNRKDRQVSTEKLRVEHKSKRSSSDPRPPKESQSASKHHGTSTLRRSESNAEDRHDAESTSSDNSLRQGDSIHKDKRRSKSVFEERSLLKSKSKSHTKQAKVPDSELQESSSRQEPEQKLDRDRNTEESDPDKLNKSKTESKALDENSSELELESGAHTTGSSQKDPSHKVKLQSVEKSTLKEKTKSDKDSSSSRLERKLSEGHRNRSLKHSGKETRKREEDNKPEDKGRKQVDSHGKVPDNDLSMDKKSSKRLAGENRRGGSSSQEVSVGEEKPSANTSVSSPSSTLQKPVRISGRTSHPEQHQEPMEIESEQRLSTQHQISQAEEESNNNSRQETKLKNTAADQTSHDSMCEWDKPKHSKETSSESSQMSNPEQKVGTVPTKEVGVTSDSLKHALKAVKPSEQEPDPAVAKNKARVRKLIPASHKDERLRCQRTAEGSQTPKNLKHMIAPSEESSSASSSSRENAAETTDPSIDGTKRESLKPTCVKDVISDSQALSTIDVNPHASNVLSSNIKDGEIADLGNTSSKARVSCKPAAEENTSVLIHVAEGSELGKVENDGTVQNKSRIGPVVFKEGSANTTALAGLEKGGKEHGKESSFVKQNKGSTEGKDRIKEKHGTSYVIESSSGSVAIPVPEISKASSRANKGGGSGDARGVPEDKTESGVVGSTIEGSKCVDHNRVEAADAIVIGTSTESSIGNSSTATSSEEGLGKGSTSHLQREGDATITCSEEKSRSVLSWASREADEGFTDGTWSSNKESPRFGKEKGFGKCSVTASEASGSVTEGLSTCESSLTSTKEGEGGDGVGNCVEPSSKPLIDSGGVELEQRINSAGREEKDDAVTSAGSEERCLASTCDRTGSFVSAATSVGETDGDGAVTSAGTDTQDEPMNTNVDDFQNNTTGTEQLKAAEGAVTCTGVERGGVGFAVCLVTGTDLQEESTVTGACAEMTDDTEAGPLADKSEDVVNGESAVTSTGITAEDDPEIAAACTGLEDSNEGFVVSLDVQGKYEHTSDSTEARAETNVTEVSRGSCDDEGFVTSTGAKEEDEEGENFVTSTGRGNEEAEHPLACTGTEDSGRAVICEEAAESGSSICLATGHLGEAPHVLAVSIDKGTVDSMTGLEKEITHDSSSKGVVESSTASVGTGNQNLMAFTTGKEEESTTSENSEFGMISATAQQSSGQFSAIAEKSEHATSYTDSRKCEDVLSRTVSNKVAMSSANEDDKGEMISTSVVKRTSEHASDKDIGQTLPLMRTGEDFEKTTSPGGAEDFEAPMPSTAVEYPNHDGASDVKPNKVSTSILEEFEAPMPSAAVEEGKSLFMTVRAVEMASTSIETYAAPMPSATTGGPDESPTSASNKEERDECTVISTSITEEPEDPVSQGDHGDPISHYGLRPEQMADASVISTSTAEASTSPAVTQEVNQVSVTRAEGRFETSAISTSTAEGSTQDVLDVSIQADSQPKDEGTAVCTNTIEESKAGQSREAADQEFRLVIQSTEETNQSSTTFAGKEGRYEALGLTLTSSQPDAQLVALSTNNPVEKTTRTVEECDSVSTMVDSEGMPLTIASGEVEDEEGTVPCAKVVDCTPSSAPGENTNSAELHIENMQSFKEKSAPSEMRDSSESIEMPTNIVNSVCVEGILSTDIHLGSSVSEGSLPEPCTHVNSAEEGGQRNEASSSPPDNQLEPPKSENSSVDSVNLAPVLNTDLSETRDLPNQKSVTLLVSELGSSFQEGALAGGTDLPGKCSLADMDAEANDHQEPRSSSQNSAAQDLDNKEVVSVVVEEHELMNKGSSEEDLQSRCPAEEDVGAEPQPEEVLKVLDASDPSTIMETIVKAPELKSLEVIVTASQKEEGAMPETDRHSAVGEGESDDGQLNLPLREEAEESLLLETRPETNMGATGTDPEKAPEVVANTQEPSSDTAEEKGEIVGKEEICEKSEFKSSLNPVEINEQVPVKRKRGRPRKYPVETPAPGQDVAADASTGNKTPGHRGRPKNSSKVKAQLDDNEIGKEAEEGKEVVVRRRGRKPKRPREQSEETGMDSPEPDKKRQKLAPAVKGEMPGQGESGAGDEKEAGDDDDDADDGDETCSGATTRAASRLEAERKQPSKPTTRAASKNQISGTPTSRRKMKGTKRSPISAQSNKSPPLTPSKLQRGKRKREASPSEVPKKGHMRRNEPETKRVKR